MERSCKKTNSYLDVRNGGGGAGGLLDFSSDF